MTAASDRTLTEDGVTAATARALRTAMHRLLTGTVRHTDGRLTKQNLWKEAGVSRATMNRAHTILAEWDDQVAQRSTAVPESARRDDEIQELRLKLAAQKRECTDLHRRLDAATTAIAALHHDNTLLRQELAHHRADVIPIRPRSPIPDPRCKVATTSSASSPLPGPKPSAAATGGARASGADSGGG